MGDLRTKLIAYHYGIAHELELVIERGERGRLFFTITAAPIGTHAIGLDEAEAAKVEHMIHDARSAGEGAEVPPLGRQIAALDAEIAMRRDRSGAPDPAPEHTAELDAVRRTLKALEVGLAVYVPKGRAAALGALLRELSAAEGGG